MPQDPASDIATLLIVDDNENNRLVLGDMALTHGYGTIIADSGPAALALLAKHKPDVILLDLRMPGMNGIETCRAIKQNAAWKDIPVIFLTASDEHDDLKAAFETGAVDYVVKPFNEYELFARVRTHVELQRSHAALLQANQLLQEQNREKNEFIGIATHDLKNPLSSVIVYAELLRSRYSKDPDKINEMSERILHASKDMVELINKFLNVNRIERGMIALKTGAYDINRLIEKAVNDFQGLAAKKNQKIGYNSPLESIIVNVDHNLLHEIMQNLISNAVKFTPIDKNIYVTTGKTNGAARITVHDEGPGITAEDMPKLFRTFSHLSAKPTGGENSTGLGLSIVKKLTELMGGKVWCESSPGEGCKFIIEFTVRSA